MVRQAYRWGLLLLSVLLGTASFAKGQYLAETETNLTSVVQNVTDKLFLEQELTLNFSNTTIKKALKKIKKKTGARFAYRMELLEGHEKLSLKAQKMTLKEVLDTIFEQYPLTYWATNDYIIIRSQKVEKKQFETVQGVVFDAQSEQTLPGVNIAVKGTNIGTSSNSEGIFTLSVPSLQDTLMFSFIGYQSKEVPINGRTSIEIEMQSTTIEGEELVVVGYGSESRQDVTGSVSSVEVQQDEARTHNNVSSLLQGKAAGVVVQASSGQPGSAVNVNVRGLSSLRGNNQPLYVVDGVIMNSPTSGNRNSSGEFGTETQPQDALTGINPSDIEDIQVLKDASATAIYGSRGANGVVLITTKSGVQGQTTVEYQGSTSIGEVSNNINMLDALGYARYQNEHQDVIGGSPNYWISEDESTIRPYRNQPPTPDDTLRSAVTPINWQKDVLRSTVNQNHRVSVSGATDQTNYFLALGFQDDDGIVEQTGLQQGDIRLNLDREVSDILTVETRLSGMIRTLDNTSAGVGGPKYSIIRQMMNKSPFLDEATSDEELDLGLAGPRAWLEDYDDRAKETRFLGGLKAKFDISDNWQYVLRLGGTIREKTRNQWYGTSVRPGEKVGGLASTSELSYFGYNVDNIVRFNSSIGEHHNLRATLVATYDKRAKKDTWTEGHDFFSESLRADGIGFANTIFPYQLSERNQSVLSGLVRLNYRLYNNYLFTASIRADGSSKFSDGNKWGYFPSFSFAWRAGNESFIKQLDLFSELKLRAGWGITGNQSLQPYQTLTPYGYAPYPDAGNNTEAGVQVNSLANKDLTWETTTQINAGLDFGFWEQRLSGSVDVYQRTTDDLLQRISIGPSNGFTRMFVNNGSIENKGIEFSLDGTIVQTSDLNFSLGGNIAFNRNEIKNLGLPEGMFGGEKREAFLGREISGGRYFKTPANIFIVGQPVGVFWGYETDGIIRDQQQADKAPTFQGIDPQAGDIKYVDQNGDGNIDPKDKTIIGNPNPDYSIGVNTSLSYKNWGLDMYVNAIQGFDIANGNLLRETYPDGSPQNIRAEAYRDAWRPDNKDGAYPRLDYEYRGTFPDRIVEDGSFIRLSNITLSYDVPVSEIKFMSNLRVYATGQNLLTITDYSGWDPEVSSFPWDGTRVGVDYNTYPKMRSVILGVNVKF